MSLRSLSDSQILSRIHELVRKEREATLQVLLHLNELERRSLHLKAGYSSLFDYCTTALKYSASAAARRIKTARCLARVPLVRELLEKNEVNLSTVAQVSEILNDANHVELLARICGRSQREVEAIVAEFQPCAMPRDRVRTVVVRVPAPGVTQRSVPAAADAHVTPPTPALVSQSAGNEDSDRACENSAYCRNGSESEGAHSERPQLETRVMLQFAARHGFMHKLDRVRSLAWHRLPSNASLESVFEFVIDAFLEREDPAKRVERRRGNKPPAPVATEGSRHIPAAIRDKVYQRDHGRCSYVGVTGRRCNSNAALQVDHVMPFARGGASTSDNLRLLCAYHNRLEAERLFGNRGERTTRSRPHARR